MDAPPRTNLTDPEFDPPLPPPVRLGIFHPFEHQRVVINPFLAILGLIGLAWLGLELLYSSLPALALPLLLPLALLPQLIQYHCLDCGQTGPYPRHRGHACSAVLARHRERRHSRLPSGRAQLVVWSWLLGSVAILTAVVVWS